MGRAPDPYATDTLLGLIGPCAAGPQSRPAALRCGELISAAVFAELLTAYGADAQAMTGRRRPAIAHRRTFRRSEDPARRSGQRARGRRARNHPGRRPASRALSPSGAIDDARARRQRFDGDRARRSARGRVGRHLHRRQRRDVGRSAPHRRRAHDATRPLARNGRARRERRQGDARARQPSWRTRTATPYTIKGLRSNVGTTIDDKAPVDRDRPVTGIDAYCTTSPSCA